jgi:hypothetical protein
MRKKAVAEIWLEDALSNIRNAKTRFVSIVALYELDAIDLESALEAINGMASNGILFCESVEEELLSLNRQHPLREPRGEEA